MCHRLLYSNCRLFYLIDDPWVLSHSIYISASAALRVAVACQSCGLWNFLQWSCVETNTAFQPSLLSLALKCTASLVQTLTDLADTDMLQLLQMLLGAVKGGATFASVEQQQLIHPGSTNIHNSIKASTNGQTSSHESGSDGIATVSLSSISLPKQIADLQSSSEPYCAAMVSVPEEKLYSFPQHMDCSVIAAALSVVCALVNHNSGRQWLEAQGLVSSFVAPCLLYPSVFVQRAAMDALTGLLHYASPHSNEKPCPLWDLLHDLTAPSLTGPGVVEKLTPRQLLSIFSSLLDKTPVGDCPDWRLQVLQERCLALQCSGPEKALKDHLTMRLALHQYVMEVLAKDGAPNAASRVQAEGALLVVVEALLQPKSAPHNTRCWVQFLQLEVDVILVLTQRGASTSFCSALGHLASSLQLLPTVLLCSSSTGSSQQQTVAQAAVSHLLRHCGRDCGRLLQVQEAVRERVGALQVGSDVLLRRQAVDAAKGLAAVVRDITLERSVSLLEQCQQLLLAMLPAPNTTSADASPHAFTSCLLPHVDLLEALLKRLGAQYPQSGHCVELSPALCRLLDTPGNEFQLIVGVLNCFRLRLVTTEPSAADADLLLQSMSRALCHTCWEVQDSALELLASALKLRSQVGVSWMKCPAVQRSAVALLESDQPFVQCSAAAVLQLAAHHPQECGGVEWTAAHQWSVSVCCSSDALAGCEGDTVTAAACCLLANLHHTRGLHGGCSPCSASGGLCRAASLLHAQHYCTSDSDLLRAAGQRYLNRHIRAFLDEESDISSGGSVVESAKACLERCCREGCAWCVLQGCADVPSVRQEATDTRALLQQAATHHKLVTPSYSGGSGSCPAKRPSDRSPCVVSPKRLCTSPVTETTSVPSLPTCSASLKTSSNIVKDGLVTARVPVDGTVSAEDGSNTTDATEHSSDEADVNEKRRVSSDAVVENRLEHGLSGRLTVHSSSKEADVILEEVLDFSDLSTLAILRRPGTGAPSSSLADRPHLPAVPLTALFDTPNSETDVDEGYEEREFLSLLEDIMLGVSASDGDAPSSPGLVFGPPTHHTMDCY